MPKVMREIDLTKYNRLLILREISPKEKKNCKGWTTKTRMVECLCDCGKTLDVRWRSVVSGRTKSCGCLKSEQTWNKNQKIVIGTEFNNYKKHIPEAKVWDNMITRCYDKSNDKYKDYGERGITVCDRWLEPNNSGLINFLTDMGKRPEGFIIDRIDVNLGYCPDNCRWIDASTSAFNQRKRINNTSGVTGVGWQKNCSKWSARINKNNITYDLGLFQCFDDAVKARRDAEIELYGQNKTKRDE